MVSSWNKYVLLFFVIYLAIGLLIYKDYGISWDEPDQRQIGYVNFNFVFRGSNDLVNFTNRDYGSFFEVPLVALERALNLKDPTIIYQTRHLITFLFFYFSVIAFYFLGKIVFKSDPKALIGCVLLVLSPRIFADSFYNSKDTPFLSMFIFSTLSLFLLLKRKNSWKILIIHSLTTAALISTRVLGIEMVGITLLALLASSVSTKQIKLILTYLILTALLTITSWPLLWLNPLNFFYSFNSLANFRFQSNLPVLYFGQYISPFKLPWHYIPVWIAVTTPMTYLVGFLLGTYLLIKQLLSQHNFRKTGQPCELVVLLEVILPIIAVIILRSTLYDGWRHLYFIYPFLILLAVKGLSYFPKVFLILITVEVATVVIFMVQYHPYQNLYFNLPLSLNMQFVRKNFELDYWGLSYRKALEFIVKNDSSERIPILVANNPGNSNSLMLDQVDRQRLQYLPDGDLTNAKYFVSNYRWHIDDYGYGQEVYNFQIGGAKIISVYKLK